jgi:concanavalin A-like lectin/glucanase superfamily protein
MTTMRWAIVLVVALGGCQRLFEIHEFEHDAPRPDGPLTIGLVAYYPMEELAMGTVHDASNGGHDGHCFDGGCPTLTVGKLGNALHFDGSTQRIEVPGSPELATMAGFSATAWINADPRMDNATWCPVGKVLGTIDANSWQLCLVSDNELEFITDADPIPPGDVIYSGVGRVETGTWTHVAVTFDGMMKRLWLNGAAVAADSTPPLLWDDGPIEIGADRDSGITMAGFPGVIDDVRIYNRALSDEELVLLATGI